MDGSKSNRLNDSTFLVSDYLIKENKYEVKNLKEIFKKIENTFNKKERSDIKKIKDIKFSLFRYKSPISNLRYFFTIIDKKIAFVDIVKRDDHTYNNLQKYFKNFNINSNLIEYEIDYKESIYENNFDFIEYQTRNYFYFYEDKTDIKNWFRNAYISPHQKEVINEILHTFNKVDKKRIFLSGEAGSGKSVILIYLAFEYLKNIQSNNKLVQIISPTSQLKEKLISLSENLERLYENCGLLKYISIITIQEFYKKYLNKNVIRGKENVLIDFIKENRKKFQLNSEKLRYLIGKYYLNKFEKPIKDNIDRDEYYFEGQEYYIFNELKLFLKKKGYFTIDEIFIDRENSNKNLLCIIDEVQDLWIEEILLLNNNFSDKTIWVYAGDENQRLSITNFTISLLKTKLDKFDKDIHLSSNYRTTKELFDFSNKIFDKINIQRSKKDARLNKIVQSDNLFLPQGENLKVLIEKPDYEILNSFIIITQEDQKEKLISDFLIDESIIFTINESKGIDFENLLLYNLYSEKDDIITLNSYYTAFTRAIKNIFWYESQGFNILQERFNLEKGKDFELISNYELKKIHSIEPIKIDYHLLLGKYRAAIEESNRSKDVIIKKFALLNKFIKNKNSQLDFDNLEKNAILRFIKEYSNQDIRILLPNYEYLYFLYSEDKERIGTVLDFYNKNNFRDKFEDYAKKFTNKRELKTFLAEYFYKYFNNNLNRSEVLTLLNKYINDEEIKKSILEIEPYFAFLSEKEIYIKITCEILENTKEIFYKLNKELNYGNYRF